MTRLTIELQIQAPLATPMIRQPTLRSEIFPLTPNHVPGYAKERSNPIIEDNILEEPICASPEPASSLDHDFNDEGEDDPAFVAKLAEFIKNERNHERVMECLRQLPTSSPGLSPQLSPRLSPQASPRASPRLVPQDCYAPGMSQSQVHPPQRQDPRFSIISASTPSTVRADSNLLAKGNPSSSANPRHYPRNSTILTSTTPPDHGPNNFRRHSTLPVPPPAVNAHSNDRASLGIASILIVFTNRSKYG